MRKYLSLLALVSMLTLASSSAVLAAPHGQSGGLVHYVAFGESLSGIAAQYGVTVEAILRHNGLVNPDFIYIGQPLVIPVGGSAGHMPGCANYHTVRTGQTLSGIAHNYNMTVQQLLQYNNLRNSDLLYVGQQLCLPTGNNYQPQPASYQNYKAQHHTVTRGETLSGIAQAYGVDYWKIMQANNLNNPAYIWVGQRLVIPGYQPIGPPVAPPYGPPAAPHYDDDYHDPHAGPPPYKEPHKEPPVKSPGEGRGQVPPAPGYQSSPVSALLPRSQHPVEVVVNGGQSWADEIYTTRDPDGITTLIVQTGDEFGKTVRVRSGDYEVKGESEYLSGEFGPSRFVFRYIPPGDYDVWIDDPETPSEKARVGVGAGDRVHLFFSKQVRFQGQTFASPDGWLLSNWENPSKPGQNVGGWSNILVRTPASGLNVLIESEGGGYQAKCFTGSKGPGACDFAGLSAGIYLIKIDGTQLTLKTYMDGNAYAVFDLTRQP